MPCDCFASLPPVSFDEFIGNPPWARYLQTLVSVPTGLVVFAQLQIEPVSSHSQPVEDPEFQPRLQ